MPEYAAVGALVSDLDVLTRMIAEVRVEMNDGFAEQRVVTAELQRQTSPIPGILDHLRILNGRTDKSEGRLDTLELAQIHSKAYADGRSDERARLLKALRWFATSDVITALVRVAVLLGAPVATAVWLAVK